MKMNCTWHLNTSVKETCIGTFESKGNFLIYWIVICVSNALLSFTALLGNSAILITVWKTSSLHTVANILLASLAVSDLAVGLVVQPLFIAFLLGRSVTKFYNMFSYFLGYVSSITITAITVDRFLAIQLPLRYHAFVTPIRVTWLIIFIWVFSGVGALLFSLSLIHFVTVTFTAISSLLVVNFAVYFKIYLIVRHHQRQIRQQQQQANNGNILSVIRLKKTALNTFFVYILLLGCYAPLAIALMVDAISSRVYMATLTLLYLNSSLNPFLYCWRDREIRTAIKRVFCG